MITFPDTVIFNAIKQPLKEYLLSIKELEFAEAENMLLEDPGKVRYICAGVGQANKQIYYKSKTGVKYSFVLSLIIAKIEGRGAGWKVAVVTIKTEQKIYISYGIIH